MLESRNIFIDTQCFVKSGLHFDGPAFKNFRKYCEAGELHHCSTTVVTREVKDKIKESVDDALNAIQTFRRKARILASLEDEKIRGLFERLHEEEVHERSDYVFEKFLAACSTEIVQASHIDVEELLSMYFEGTLPFSEGKKKSEFPDAISILSLKSRFKDGEKIYVVSDDSDMKKYCDTDPQCISVESLDKLLDIYTTHTSVRHNEVKQYFISNAEAIKKDITDFLEGCEVYNSSTWEDAEVDGGLRVLNVGDFEPSVLFIDDEESQITFDVDVEYEVTVIGPDYINGVYDREGGRVYTFDSTTKTEICSSTFTVELFLYYNFIDGRLANAERDGLYIAGTAGGIEVSVDEI